MSSDKKKKEILEFTVKELEKVLNDLKRGKTPTFPKTLKQISDLLNIKSDKINDDIIIDKISEDIKK